MSGHADTIRMAIPLLPTRWAPRHIPDRNEEPDWTSREDVGDALDALLAENQRYEKALVEIERLADSAEFKAKIAREALTDDAE